MGIFSDEGMASARPVTLQSDPGVVLIMVAILAAASFFPTKISGELRVETGYNGCKVVEHQLRKKLTEEGAEVKVLECQKPEAKE